MKKSMFAVLLAVILPLAAFGQAKNEDLISWTPSVSVYPKYLFSNGFIAYDGPVVQVNNTLTYKPWGLSFTYWESFASKPGFGREKDYSIEKAFMANGYDVVLGFAYYALFDNNDILQPYVDISRPQKFDNDKLTISPALRLEFPQVTARTKFEGGNIAHLRLDASYQITDRLSVSGSLAGVYDDGVGGLSAGFVARAEGKVSYAITKHFTAGVNAKFTTPLTTHDVRSSTLVPGFFVSGSFKW